MGPTGAPSASCPELVAATDAEGGKAFLASAPGGVAAELGEALREQQLQQWLAHPEWTEVAPHVEVSNPKGMFLRLDCSVLLGLPPGDAFALLCDPGNKRVFKNVKGVRNRRVVEETESRTVLELELVTGWRFLVFSGEFGVLLRLTQDRSSMQVSFELAKPGFMRLFKGEWAVEPVMLEGNTMEGTSECSQSLDDTIRHCDGADGRPAVEAPRVRVGSKVTLVQQVQPALSPPPILAQYLRQIAAKTLRESLQDMQMEAARVRFRLPKDAGVLVEEQSKWKPSHYGERLRNAETVEAAA